MRLSKYNKENKKKTKRKQKERIEGGDRAFTLVYVHMSEGVEAEERWARQNWRQVCIGSNGGFGELSCFMFR